MHYRNNLWIVATTEETYNLSHQWEVQSTTEAEIGPERRLSLTKLLLPRMSKLIYITNTSLDG